MIKVGELVAYSVEEMAEMLGLHQRTVRGMLREGRLKGSKVGKKWYVTEANLKDMFKEPGHPQKEEI